MIKRFDIVAAIIGIWVLGVAAITVPIRGLNPVYYVAIAVGLICVAVYLVYFRKIDEIGHFSLVEDWMCWLSVAFICMIGLLPLWAINTLYPDSLIGLDPWTHKRIVTQELDIALGLVPNNYGINPLNISTIGGYFSLMHLYLKGWMVLTGLDYKWAALIFSSSVNMVGTVIMVYMVGKEITNKSTAMLASLFVATAGWVIMYAEWNIPNSSGGLLCMVVAYLIIKAWKTHTPWLAWFSLAVLAVGLVTHTLVSAWITGTIVCLSIFTKGKIRYLLPVAAVAMIAGWYTFSSVGVAAQEVATYMQTVDQVDTPLVLPDNSISSPIVIPSDPVTASMPVQVQQPAMPLGKGITYVDVLNNGNTAELALDGMGMFLYMGMALIGVLMMLRTESKMWPILCAGTLAVGFIAPVLDIVVLKDRWWYLAEVFMAIPLAVVFMAIFKGRTECVE